MSISTDLTRLQSAKAAMKTAMQNKGVTVPDDAKLDAFAALIDSIPAGGGGYTVEAHVVTFAEDVTCAKGDMVELCDTPYKRRCASVCTLTLTMQRVT